MKKNGWILLLFVLIGLLGGAMVSRWLATVPGLDFLTRTYPVNWSPSADLLVINYHIQIGFNLSLLSVAGVVLAIWIYRKM